MTFVGKILVIVIMIFALFFLALSTVVFTTEKNWKEETGKQKAKVSELLKNVSTVKEEAQARTEELAKAQAAHKAEAAQWELAKTNLETQNKQRQDEITDQRKALEVALQNASAHVKDAEARKAETDQLRKILDDVQKQSNEYKLRQTELNDQIRILDRELNVAKNNNRTLRDRVAALSTVIRTHNLSDDVNRIKAVDNPPDVEGEISKVDAGNSRVEITIGSDDGLVPGNTLYIYRTKGEGAGYLGKIQIDLVDPDQASAHVVGKTVSGKKLREGDHVTTKIKSRG
jgi:multidrug efflux pump subunit AcrA (membrane-fusion protein)